MAIKQQEIYCLEIRFIFRVHLFSCQRMKSYCIEVSEDIYTLRFAPCQDRVALSIGQLLNW